MKGSNVIRLAIFGAKVSSRRISNIENLSVLTIWLQIGLIVMFLLDTDGWKWDLDGIVEVIFFFRSTYPKRNVSIFGCPDLTHYLVVDNTRTCKFCYPSYGI